MSDKKPLASSIVRTGGMVAVGTLAGSNPVGAGLVGAAIEPAALVAGHLQEWFGARFTKRVAETTQSLVERIEAEGIEPGPEHLAELLENGLPFVGRASREEKRRLMEEILMNGIRSLDDEAKRAEAIKALQWIEDIDDSALMIFAEFVNLYDDGCHAVVLRDGLPRCGLSEFVADQAVLALYNHGAPTAKIGHHLLVTVEYRNQNGSTEKYIVSSAGKWLADWIINNPSSRRDPKEQAVEQS